MEELLKLIAWLKKRRDPSRFEGLTDDEEEEEQNEIEESD